MDGISVVDGTLKHVGVLEQVPGCSWVHLEAEAVPGLQVGARLSGLSQYEWKRKGHHHLLLHLEQKCSITMFNFIKSNILDFHKLIFKHTTILLPKRQNKPFKLLLFLDFYFHSNRFQ